MTVSKTMTELRALHELFSNSENFTQIFLARTPKGKPIGPLEANATCWCVMGACDKITGTFFDTTLTGCLVRAADTLTDGEAYLGQINDGLQYLKDGSTGLDAIRKIILQAIMIQAVTEGRELILDPSHWTQKTFARDEDGFGVNPNQPNATCWCAIGAVRHAIGPGQYNLGIDAERILEQGAVSIGLPDDIPEINDEMGHEAVIRVFDATLERLHGPSNA